MKRLGVVEDVVVHATASLGQPVYALVDLDSAMSWDPLEVNGMGRCV